MTQSPETPEATKPRDPLGPVARIFDNGARMKGARPEGCGWTSTEAVHTRFEQLARLFEAAPQGRAITVNDLGCGYGALFNWLERRLDPPLAGYRGYDISDGMIALARQSIHDPRATFVQADRPDRPADFGLVSGTFNLMGDTPRGEWEAMIRHSLTQLAQSSRYGIAFNLLRADGPKLTGRLYTADPADWVRFATRLGRKVHLLTDYLPEDFTVLVRR
ncbi:class I SAM-dependent methyltransferase [Roseospirillum parvum]|uniref:Methyltransferase domain-containing protein n=1 Tax=Roseospirillum parvum TaxID=83401 RepID=A0A1G7ZJP2_9PROT|nr:class I SAM-dependent methyltransferase [Roseospirillum parvum]SDH08849.1 Methyltransferase domain-containing protein [Roseospirillum parvum]